MLGSRCKSEVPQRMKSGRYCITGKGPRPGRHVWAGGWSLTEGYTWRGQFHPHKLVRIIYLVQPEKISMVTVYVYYGKWEV